MDVEIWMKLAGVFVLLVLSAIFSSMESAYFSLNRALIEELSESSDPRAKRVAKLMSKPHRLLATFLAGNTIVNTAAASLAALIAVEYAAKIGADSNLAIAVEVVIITIVILFFAEVTPKLVTLRDPKKWSLFGSATVYTMNLLLSPIALPLSRLTSKISEMFGIEKHSMLAMSEEEIRALVQVGHEHGALELEERRMIHSIFEFGETIVREVMVPRIDMIAVEDNTSLEDLLDTIVSKGHSRIPIFGEKIDNIVGLIYAKDLLKVAQNPEAFELQKLLRPAFFIPEEKKIDDLLQEFQKEKIHIAIVVDEYGGTAGIVTLEDIIEEIVGEIQDEYDSEQPESNRIDENTLIVSGRMSSDDINETLGYQIVPDSEAYDTIAGFVFSQLGEVPDKGQEFEFEGYRFIVEDVSGKKISKVRIVRDGGVPEGV